MFRRACTKTVANIINGASTFEGDVSKSPVATVKTNEVDVVLGWRIGGEVLSELRGERVRMHYVPWAGTVGRAIDAFKPAETGNAAFGPANLGASRRDGQLEGEVLDHRDFQSPS